MTRRVRLAATLCALLACAARPALADRVLTTDGRVLTPQKAREEGAGYRLTFEHGVVVLPDRTLIASAEIEGDMADYVPANDDERQKLAQGYVKHRGKWLSSPAYKEELRKQTEASKKRTEELALHSDWSNAWVKETAHFRVASNTSSEILAYYAELLETYYNLMDERIGIDPPLSLKRTRMQVNVYKSYEDFQALAKPGNPAVLGFFSPMAKSLNFFHDYAEPSRSEWVALHECTHLLTFLVDPQYAPQIWLNEAIADFFGSSKVYRDKKGKLKIEPGEVQLDRILTVQQALRGESVATGDAKKSKSAGSPAAARPFTKLEDLFLLKRDEFDGFQYAHAWAFVYFLNTSSDGKYRKPFDRFFKGLYTLETGIPYSVDGGGKVVKPEDIRAYLLKTLKVKDVAALEHEWRDFLAAIPIEGPKARLKRGLLAVRQLRYEDALPDLDAAIELGTKDPRAWAFRGRVLAVTGEKDKALADYRAAIERDPLAAGFRYELSRVLAGLPPAPKPPSAGSSGASLEAEDDEDAPKLKNDEARTQAGLALEMAPDNDRFRVWYERFE